MKFLTDVFHLLGRQVRLTKRMPVMVAMSVVQPIFWMILFSQLFGKAIGGMFGGNYTQFLAPGIAIMSAMFGSSFSGMGLLNDLDRGVVDRFLATPVARSALIVARVIHAGMLVTIQSTIILTVATVLGARPKAGALSFLAVLIAAALLGAGMGGISNCMAILTRRQEAMFAILNFMMMPMIYLSSMIMVKSMMPKWILNVSTYNPVDWAVTAARGGFEGKDWPSVFEHTGFLLCFTAVFASLATLAFRRYRATM